GNAARGGLGRGRHTGHVRRDLGGTGRRLGDAAVHLVGGRGLLLDGRGDRELVVVDLRDDLADLPDRVHRAGGVVLDRLDPPRDVLGRPRGLLREVLHLVGDDREAL